MPITHYRDADLFYRLSGEPENPAMLLLHGGFGSAEDFAAILPELQQHFLVVETDAGYRAAGIPYLWFQRWRHGGLPASG